MNLSYHRKTLTDAKTIALNYSTDLSSLCIRRGDQNFSNAPRQNCLSQIFRNTPTLALCFVTVYSINFLKGSFLSDIEHNRV